VAAAFHVIIVTCETVTLAEKLPNGSRSSSSLESYGADHPLSLCDSAVALKSPATAAGHTSRSNTPSARGPPNLRVDDNVSVCCDLAAEVKGSLLDIDNNMATGALQASVDTLLIASDCDSANCLPDKNAGAHNTSETALSNSENTQKLENSVEVSVMNPVTGSQSNNEDSYFHDSLSLNTTDAWDTSGAVRLGLRVSVDTAVPSQGFTATVTSPSEDFQSIYASNVSRLTATVVTDGAPASEPQTTDSDPDSDSMDAWLEFPAPGKPPAQSLCVSRRTAWYVDKADRLYFSSLKGPGLSWIGVNQSAQHVSCSPSGYIVWTVYRGSAYSAVGRITGKSPAGTEWREVAREVAYVAADDNVVW